MSDITRRLLVPLAIAVALVISVLGGLRLYRAIGFLSVLKQITDEDASSSFDDKPLSEICYPFPWQIEKRERLRALLQRADRPPAATDELGLARYAEYALQVQHHDPQFETIMREGMRRDPDNALYHYLLAAGWLKDALAGDPPKKDEQTKQVVYHYVVKNRALLDRAMREVAIGLDLPYRSRRMTLLRARLDALPPAERYEEQWAQFSVVAAILYPDYAAMRQISRVNGFYLSLLLADGRRAEAQPYLRTGETLVLQIMQDDPPTLIGSLVALALSAIPRENDSQVCRQYGLEREAAALQTRLIWLTCRLMLFKQAHMNSRDLDLEYYRHHANLLGAFFLHIMGQDRLTLEALAPGRLSEYVLAELVILSLLPVALLLGMLFAGLQVRHWRAACAGGDQGILAVPISAAGWWRAILLGYLLPLVLYLLCRSVPLLSGRDTSLLFGLFPFAAKAAVCFLWILIVPATIAAGEMRRQVQATALAYRNSNIAHAVLRVYAVIILLIIPLFPLLRIEERHYLRADRITSILDNGAVVYFPAIEGRIVLGLRREVLREAEKLGIPVRKP